MNIGTHTTDTNVASSHSLNGLKAPKTKAIDSGETWIVNNKPALDPISTLNFEVAITVNQNGRESLRYIKRTIEGQETEFTLVDTSGNAIPLNSDQYKMLSDNAPSRLSFTRRTYFMESELHINVDEFQGDLHGLILARVAERFSTDRGAIRPQAWLTQNVTEDRGYSLLQLGMKGIPR